MTLVKVYNKQNCLFYKNFIDHCKKVFYLLKLKSISEKRSF